MKPDEDEWDEALFSSIMHSTDHDMPAPDADFLARLRERSTQAFLETGADSVPQPVEAGKRPAIPAPDAAGSAELDAHGCDPRGRPPGSIVPPVRRRLILSLVKGLSVCAVVAVAAFGLWSFFGTHDTQVAFGAALDRVALADTLHL